MLGQILIVVFHIINDYCLGKGKGSDIQGLVQRCRALLEIASCSSQGNNNNTSAFGLASEQYDASSLIALPVATATARQKYYKKMSCINSIVCKVYNARDEETNDEWMRDKKTETGNMKLNKLDASSRKLEQIFRNGDREDVDVRPLYYILYH